ncbi:MAG TPA: hypothetical protein VFN64_07765 [Burkholderiaceae bacterium]|nr:hypothetical protein [Burkholderiaceae bacterium]
MFVGHFAAALAAKAIAPRTSLGTLTFAAQWIDLLWPTLLLAGFERVRIEPGATATNPLVFEHYPWSHSLAAVCAWALVIGTLHFTARRDARAAIVIGSLVVSHWLLDAVVHVPDLPVVPGGTAVGAGLWNHREAALLLELGLLAVGTAIYLRTTAPRDRIGRWALAMFIAFLVVIQLGNTFGAPPPGVTAIAWVGQLQWLLVAWALWIDRHRAPRGSARISEATA